eukprot:329563-Pleurochrysis_carterae.AAC.7
MTLLHCGDFYNSDHLAQVKYEYVQMNLVGGKTVYLLLHSACDSRSVISRRCVAASIRRSRACRES